MGNIEVIKSQRRATAQVISDEAVAVPVHSLTGEGERAGTRDDGIFTVEDQATGRIGAKEDLGLVGLQHTAVDLNTLGGAEGRGLIEDERALSQDRVAGVGILRRTGHRERGAGVDFDTD